MRKSILVDLSARQSKLVVNLDGLVNINNRLKKFGFIIYMLGQRGSCYSNFHIPRKKAWIRKNGLLIKLSISKTTFKISYMF